MNRTKLQDETEATLIDLEMLLEEYGTHEGLFIFNDTKIVNPYMDEYNSLQVDPIEYYGDTYINWYQSL